MIVTWAEETLIKIYVNHLQASKADRATFGKQLILFTEAGGVLQDVFNGFNDSVFCVNIFKITPLCTIKSALITTTIIIWQH